MRAIDRSDIARAGIALAGAATLWLVVTVEEPMSAWVPVTVTLSMDSSMVLRSPVSPVFAYVVGRRRDLLRMVQTRPVLHRAVTNDGDSVRFELRETDLDLPEGTEARVTDVQPRLLVVQLAHH